MSLAGSAAPSSTVSRRGRTPVFLGLVLWLVAIAYFLLPVTVWVFDAVILAVMWMFGIAGIICVAIGAICRHRVVAGVVAVTVMVLITAAVGQWWSLSPRGWFATHRTLYERALRVEPGDGYYGRALPWHLRFLTVNGRVSGRGTSGSSRCGSVCPTTPVDTCTPPADPRRESTCTACRAPIPSP